MKRLAITEVANGWIVAEQFDPGMCNNATMTVWETVEGLQRALPALLGKEQTTSPRPSPPAERENASAAPGTPEWHKLLGPSCPLCKSNQFVKKCVYSPDCWVCDRPDCDAKHFTDPKSIMNLCPRV